MQSRVPKAIPSAVLTQTAQNFYTAPALTTATINNLSLTNFSAAPARATLYRVPSGGAPGNENTILAAFSIAAGRTLVPAQAIGLQLDPGMTLQAIADTGGAISMSGGLYESSGD